MNYYNRHLGDYARDTVHLSLLEHGAYTVLLDWAYASHRALPESELEVFRICRAITKPEQAAARRVMKEFFPGGRNKRVTSEIVKFTALVEKNSASAKDRWKKSNNRSRGLTGGNAPDMPAHMPSHSEGITGGNAPASPTQCENDPSQTPNPKPQTPVPPNPPLGGGDEGEVFGGPTDREAMDFAVTWPGEAATGTPRMADDFVDAWLARMNLRHRGWPVSWKRAMVASWREEHRHRLTGAHLGKKNGGPVLSVNIETLQLQQELRGLRAELDGDYETGVELDPEKMVREKVIKKRLEELKSDGQKNNEKKGVV